MSTIISLIDNTKYTYTNYKEIPIDFYDKIISLKCTDCNLDNIDFIKDFPNLTKLKASNNNIKTIPLINNLEELEIYNNKLITLPLFIKLRKLYAFNNQLVEIPLLDNLEIIDVSHNNIVKILLGDKIEKIYIGYNRLNNIKTKSKKIIEIQCNNNFLQNIDFIQGLSKLECINYDDNNIKIIPNYIKRYLPNENIFDTNSKHIISKKTADTILNIIQNNKMTYSYNKIKSDIINYNLLSKKSILLLKKYTDSKFIEPTIRLSYLELFMHTWDYILINNRLKHLDIVLINNNCNCVSCLFENLMNVFN
jgi:hypothetical protein